MIRVFAIIFAVLAAIASGWLGYRLSAMRAQPAPASGPVATQAAEPFDEKAAQQGVAHLLGTNFIGLDGKVQTIKQWSGKVMVVNFWATWCPPCREEMPGFSRLQKKLAANGVQFVGIGVDEPGKVEEFQKQFPVSYPLLVAGLETMDLTRELGNSTEGLPYTLIIDRQGQLRLARAGRMDEADVERELRLLL
jgi:thiol-disulfide isomerase/thioredoxin